MKNNQGFTLVELLAVIVVLAIVITIAVPSTMRVSNKIKENMFCTKIGFIENAAELYGEDKKDSINEIDTIPVKELVDKGYLKKDQNNSPYIQDPRDKKQGLDNNYLTLYKKNNRIHVAFWKEASNLCEKMTNNMDNLNISFSSNNYEITEDRIYCLNDCSSITDNINVTNGSISVNGNQVTILNDNGIKVLDLIEINIGNSGLVSNPDSDGLMVNGTNISYVLNNIVCTNCTVSIYRNNQTISNGYFQIGDKLQIKIDGNIIEREITYIR